MVFLAKSLPPHHMFFFVQSRGQFSQFTLTSELRPKYRTNKHWKKSNQNQMSNNICMYSSIYISHNFFSSLKCPFVCPVHFSCVFLFSCCWNYRPQIRCTIHRKVGSVRTQSKSKVNRIIFELGARRSFISFYFRIA